jgi:hypothetical protein
VVPDFLRWQLGTADRRLCVAAYDEDRLVGVFFSVPHSLRIGATVHPMTLSSWCSIDPEYRLPGLAVDLAEALRHRHEDAGLDFSLGFVSGDRSSLAHRFWTGYARIWPRNCRFMFRFGVWVKVLNAPAVARAGVAPWERLGLRVAGPVLQRIPWGRGHRPRPYEPRDLDVCSRLLETATRPLDWALAWSPERLARQLEGPVPRTLLFERDGTVHGLANYHHMDWQGREPVRTALLDLWAAPGLPRFEVSSWLGSVCRHLRSEEADMVLCLQGAMVPASALLANAFVARPAAGHLVLLFQRSDAPVAPPGAWNLLLR